MNESCGQAPAAFCKDAQPNAKSELDVVKELAERGSPEAEIAAVIGMPEKKFARRYRKVFRQARAQGAAELRRVQWSKADEGSVPMLIWLGRQMLGQSQEPAAPEAEALPGRVVLDMSQNP